jgi:hypothetical protein
MENSEFDNLPWDKIKEISEKVLFEEVFKRIPKARLQFAAKEENREMLISSALKSLQKTDPNTTLEQASILADLMQEFARKILEG